LDDDELVADADVDVVVAGALDPAAAVAWVEPEAAPPAAFDVLDEPPHAASSSTNDPSPVAAAHPLVRI